MVTEQEKDAQSFESGFRMEVGRNGKRYLDMVNPSRISGSSGNLCVNEKTLSRVRERFVCVGKLWQRCGRIVLAIRFMFIKEGSENQNTRKTRTVCIRRTLGQNRK